jgi:hypothetical protein
MPNHPTGQAKITCAELEASGYVKHSATMFNRYSDFFYQKKFRDDKGVKYFIEFVHYPAGLGHVALPEAWMARLSNNEPHMTVEIHRPISIADAERRFELFFQSQQCEYYELAG